MVNRPLYQFSASCLVQFILWAWQHIGFIVFQPTWYQDVPFYCLSVCQVSKQSNNVFLWQLQHLDKKKKNRKNEENKLIFESLCLKNAWCDLFKFWNVWYWQWRTSPQQKLSGFVEEAQRYVCVKNTLLFFLSIYP